MIRFLLPILFAIPMMANAMNGFYQIGYGTSAKGMGGVGIALPQDAWAAANNPAGMALLGCRFDGGIDWILLDGHLKVDNSTNAPSNRSYTSSSNSTFPELAANYMFSRCISIGLSLYMNGLTDVDYDRSIPLLGTSDVRFSAYQYVFAPNLSWIINCNHSLGIALNIGTTWFRADGLQALADNSAHPTDVTDRGWETQTGLGFTLGWLGHYSDCLSVGVAYKSPIWTSRFAKYRGLLADGGSFDTPHTIGVGTAYFPFCCLVIASDIQYIFWKGPKTFGNAPNVDRQSGSSDGSGLAWKGQFVWKVGVACDLFDCLTLRAGYNFGYSVIDGNERFAPWVNTKTLATERHHLTFGLTYAWCWSEINFAYVHGFEEGRRGAIPGGGTALLRRSHDQISISYGHRF